MAYNKDNIVYEIARQFARAFWNLARRFAPTFARHELYSNVMIINSRLPDKGFDAGLGSNLFSTLILILQPSLNMWNAMNESQAQVSMPA